MDRVTGAFGVSFAITTLLSALLVVAKELNHGVFQWVADLTGHHWITHGVLQITVFVVLGIALLGKSPVNARWLTVYVVGGTVVGSAIIGGFFFVK